MTRFSMSAVIALLCLAALAGDATPLKSWGHGSLNGINLYAAPGSKASIRLAPDEKTQDGDAVIVVELKAVAPEAKPWDMQLSFLHDGGLKAGRNYEISFRCQASEPGTVQFATALADKPWTPLPGASGGFEVAKEWKTVKLPFPVQQDWSAKLAAPRLMLAKLNAPSTLRLGPVSLYEKAKELPFMLGGEWRVLLGADAASLKAFAEPPAGKLGKAVALKGSSIDLAKLAGSFKGRDCAVLFKQFDSPEAGTMRIGVAADWWLELHANGRKVYDNAPAGNESHAFSPSDHVIEIPVNAGRNTVAVKVLAGSAGWRFVCGEATRAADSTNVFTVRANSEWKPVLISKAGLVPKPGTVLDFSALCGERRPAGEKGRVIANAAGRLAFEKEPDTPIRLRGMNSWSCSWALWMATKPEIDAWAKAMAMRGYNAIRFQGVDLALVGGVQQSGKWPVGQAPESPHFDPKALDSFDYLLSRLKANGIYCSLDLMSSPSGFGRVSPPPGEGFNIQLLFNLRHRAHWEAAAKELLERRNPYTGVCLKDEPALASLEPYNEQDILINSKPRMAQFTPYFRKSLAAKYKTAEALQAAWGQPGIAFDTVPDINEAMLRGGDVRAADACAFLLETMGGATDWYIERLRAAGYPGIVLHWDMIMRSLEVSLRAKLDASSQHSYFAHPNYAPAKGLLKKSFNSIFMHGKDYDMLMGQESSLNSSYIRAAAATRLLDRPFMLTEFSHSAPNRYRHERGLFAGAYAALQGWDALYPHGDVVALWPAAWFNDGIPPIASFETMQDPIACASEAMTAFAWFRGDLKEASHSVALSMKPGKLFPKHALDAVGDDYAKLSMLTKTGLLHQGGPSKTKSQPDITLEPEAFSHLEVTQWYASASQSDGKLLPSLVERLRKAGILNASNKTDCARRIFQSETGETTLDAAHETMTVCSPRLEGAVVKGERPADIGRVRIESCSKPAALAIASLDKGKSLGDSKRLLLIFSTNALNSEMAFENSSMILVVEPGAMPALMETAKLELSLRRDVKDEKLSAYALNLDGTRAQALPCAIEEGAVRLKLDTAKLEYGTPFFELEFH